MVCCLNSGSNIITRKWVPHTIESCCVFQQANGSFARRWLVKIICFCMKTSFFIFSVTNGKKKEKWSLFQITPLFSHFIHQTMEVIKLVKNLSQGRTIVKAYTTTAREPSIYDGKRRKNLFKRKKMILISKRLV